MKVKNLFILYVIGVLGYGIMSYFFQGQLINRIYLFLLVLSFFYALDKIHKMGKSSMKWTKGVIALFSAFLFIECFSPYTFNFMTIYVYFLIILMTIAYAFFYKRSN